jgi:hypothetical protein
MNEDLEEDVPKILETIRELSVENENPSCQTCCKESSRKLGKVTLAREEACA